MDKNIVSAVDLDYWRENYARAYEEGIMPVDLSIELKETETQAPQVERQRGRPRQRWFRAGEGQRKKKQRDGGEIPDSEVPELTLVRQQFGVEGSDDSDWSESEKSSALEDLVEDQ
ncbi:hypothetical protein P9112_007922 [Eukaryota sp. TZLM1-RC]